MNGDLTLVLKQDLKKALPAVIQFNYEELKARLGELLEKYRNLHIAEEDIPRGKEDRATLGRFIDALEGARKEVKKACLAPYADFEAKVKELVAMVDAPRAAIDAQLKNYEEERKAERRRAMEEFFDGHVGDLWGLFPFDRILDPKWLNKSCRDAEWQGAIMARLKEIRQGLDSIKMVAPGEFRNEAESKYLATFSLPEVFEFLQERKEQAARLARREEEARRAREEAAAAVPPPGFDQDGDAARRAQTAAMIARFDATVAAPPPAPVVPAATLPDPEITFTLRFTGRKSALVAMRRFMDANGISYVKLPDAAPADPAPAPADPEPSPDPAPAPGPAPANADENDVVAMLSRSAEIAAGRRVA